MEVKLPILFKHSKNLNQLLWKVIASFLILAISTSTLATCQANTQGTIVFLKLDDLVGIPDGGGSIGVSQRWQRVTEFLESNNLAASYGLIGESLEKENNSYFSWLKSRVSLGLIEFWNHGYRNHFLPNKLAGELGEFNGTSSDAQSKSIRKTQQLAYTRIGIALHGFGPHSSAVDENTFTQLDNISEIRYVWFYKPIDQIDHRAVVVKRAAELEAPIFHPNFEAFMKTYSNRDHSIGYVSLQGHPNEWDDSGFETFKKIVQWLQHEGATFCRPSDIVLAK